MCGRVNVSDHPGVQILMDYLDLPIYTENFTPRFNIAPGAGLYTAFADKQQLQSSIMQWGIMPKWAKGDQFNRPLINARAESIWQKPSFKQLIKSQRAVVPVNGFYEWHRSDKNKIPYHIHPKQDQAMALAGIYQISSQGEMQVCLVTTAANARMKQIHHRMPVILPAEAMKDWILTEDRKQLNSLMQAKNNDYLQFDQVSNYVNNAANEGARCIETNDQSSETKSSSTQSQISLKFD